MSRFNSTSLTESFDPQKLHRTDIREIEERSLREIENDVVPRDTVYEEDTRQRQVGESDPNRLHGDALLCFQRIAQGPETIETRCDGLGWDRDREGRAKQELRKRGAVEVIGTLGNKRRLFGLTEKGLALARKHGIAIGKYKSGGVHEAALREFQRLLSQGIRGIAFHDKGYADVLGGVQADTVAKSSGGQLWPIQICHGNKATYEVTRLRQLAGLDVVDLVISVSVNRTTREKIEKELTRQEGEQWPAKLVLLDIERCMKTTDWSWLMERLF